MSIPLIDVKIADERVHREIKESVSRLIDQTAFVGGEPVARFSEEFARYCGGGHCAPVANGTDALILALRALGIGPGDEVITVPFTFIATAEAITVAGAKIKFVDIDPKTYTLDATQLEAAITPNTKAILPVHLYGHPADMDLINAMAKKHGLKVVEDAAQAHGAEYKGKRVGLLSDAGCFSFYPTKNLGAMGDGGAVVSSSPDLIKKVEQLGNHGRAEQYFHAVEGVNSRLDAIQAAALRVKLRYLDQFNDRRRAIAAAYNKALGHQSFITPPHVDSHVNPVFHLYIVETSHRDALVQELRRKKIGCGVYYPLPLHLQPAYAWLKLTKGAFPVSERASERVLALPMHPNLTDEQVETVAETITKFSPNVIA